MREQLHRRLTLPAYKEWARHYEGTGFTPWALRAALAVQTADFRNANRDPKKSKPAKPADVIVPQPSDRRSEAAQRGDVAAIEDQFLAWSPI